MKYSKLVAMLCIAVASIFMLSQASYAMGLAININQPKSEETDLDVNKAIQDETTPKKGPGVLDGGRSAQMQFNDLVSGKLPTITQEFTELNKRGQLPMVIAGLLDYGQNPDNKVTKEQLVTAQANIDNAISQINKGAMRRVSAEERTAEEAQADIITLPASIIKERGIQAFQDFLKSEVTADKTVVVVSNNSTELDDLDKAYNALTELHLADVVWVRLLRQGVDLSQYVKDCQNLPFISCTANLIKNPALRADITGGV